MTEQQLDATFYSVSLATHMRASTTVENIFTVLLGGVMRGLDTITIETVVISTLNFEEEIGVNLSAICFDL